MKTTIIVTSLLMLGFTQMSEAAQAFYFNNNGARSMFFRGPPILHLPPIKSGRSSQMEPLGSAYAAYGADAA